MRILGQANDHLNIYVNQRQGCSTLSTRYSCKCLPERPLIYYVLHPSKPWKRFTIGWTIRTDEKILQGIYFQSADVCKSFMFTPSCSAIWWEDVCKYLYKISGIMQRTSSCWTFGLHCSQRLILYLNNLFYFGEHFQTHRFLVKHWRKYYKTQTTKVSNGESDSTEATSHQKFQLPPHTSHLFTLTFFPAENWYMDVKTTANPQLTSWLWRWRNVGILEEKISIPPHTSVPPGLRLPGFHLPSSSPCHQEVAGRGYLLPRSQWYDKWSAACEQSQSTKKYPIVVCCQPDEKLKNIGLTCPGTWGLPGNLSSEKKLMRLAPPSL